MFVIAPVTVEPLITIEVIVVLTGLLTTGTIGLLLKLSPPASTGAAPRRRAAIEVVARRADARGVKRAKRGMAREVGA